jgi:mRNA-degrading endonuclease RelE of RelBE toxin-antitoxin system
MRKVLVEESALEFIESVGKHAENIKENLRLLKGSPYPEEGLGDKKEIKDTSKTAFRMHRGEYRALSLPTRIEQSKVSYKNGILEISIAKTEKGRQRKINIE